jgi:hypothetical protein
MNIPNFADLYQAVLSASDFCPPWGGAVSSAPAIEDKPINKTVTISPKTNTTLLA